MPRPTQISAGFDSGGGLRAALAPAHLGELAALRTRRTSRRQGRAVRGPQLAASPRPTRAPPPVHRGMANPSPPPVNVVRASRARARDHARIAPRQVLGAMLAITRRPPPSAAACARSWSASGCSSTHWSTPCARAVRRGDRGRKAGHLAHDAARARRACSGTW